MPCSEILLNPDQLKEIVNDMAGRISAEYQNKDDVLALVAMNGAKHFADDLLAAMDFPIDVIYVKARSYIGTCSGGTVEIQDNDGLHNSVLNKNTLLIDDIYDTGQTLSKLLQWITDHGAADVKTCVLLEKDISHEKDVQIDFLGTKIEDAFLVGYGLDYNGQYRTLPYIGILDENIIGTDQPDQLETASD